MTTHTELVEAAAKWLRSRCPVVITEMAHGGGEECDVIGWHSTYSIVLECKASRTDFLRDRQKCHMRSGHLMGSERWYVAPRGMLKGSEVPEGWGLLEYEGGKFRRLIVAEPRSERAMRPEMSLLLSALRRVGQRCPQGVSVRCYTHETYNRASLSVEPVADIDGCKSGDTGEWTEVTP